MTETPPTEIELLQAIVLELGDINRRLSEVVTFLVMVQGDVSDIRSDVADLSIERHDDDD